ncbi:serine hydrolase [Xiamenia xianingshaonis]|uniref:Serine hydrolase n=1 Tax=Xiamenia xianingshaonis TaxID=2682776 RepID=A0A9E6MR19_9ACTN|nr:serine hydrolase [Xiamenia xianingshaonis]NHM13398.1 serine hydrolase [Xiamenia xianingshaonis]QTU84523.1 serine hydrolase [Xiamenia xianingshaonis]
MAGKHASAGGRRTVAPGGPRHGRAPSSPSRKSLSGTAVGWFVAAALLSPSAVTTALIAIDLALFPQHSLVASEAVVSADAADAVAAQPVERPASSQTAAHVSQPEDAAGEADAGKRPDEVAAPDAQALEAALEPASAPGCVGASSALAADIRDVPRTTFSLAESLKVARAALAGLADVADSFVFDGVTATAFPFEGEDAKAVQAALDAFSEAGYDVGFLVYDLASAAGVGYNIDEAFFSASTVKAPFAAYVLDREIAAGNASWDEELHEDVVVEGTGVMADDDRDDYSLGEVLENTIVHSDNTGYALLLDRFGADGFAAWAADAAVEVDPGEFAEVRGYPFVSARTMALLWAASAAPVLQGTPDPWRLASGWGAYAEAASSPLAGWLASTDESFIAEALGDGALVLSKPGYEISSDVANACLSECGLVIDESGPYLIAVMTNADFDDASFRDNEPLMVDLVRALAASRPS